MMIKMDGKNLSLKIKEDLKSDLYSYFQTPVLAVVTVGDDDASKVYVNNKKKACEFVGISMMHFNYDENSEETEIINKIKELNEDKTVNGIILQLPIPKKFNARKILNTIDPNKDVDGLTDISMGRLMSGNSSLIPCTPKGILEIFDYYKIDLDGKTVVIVGRSDLVGKPLILECLKRNATVIACHSHTKNLEEYTKKADVLIVAVGKKHLIDKDMVKEGSVIIDVGITREDGKIYGDVNPNVEEKCSYVTPVPGGVGPMTVSMLLKNTVTAYKMMNEVEEESKKLELK